MADLSAQQPLLSNKGVEVASFNKARFSASAFAQWALKILMWMILVAWVALIFFYPSEFVHEPYSKFVQATRGTIFGVTGSIFLIFSGPIFGKNSKFPKFRLWTFPILIDGPFGVVSAAELIGIVMFSAYILWVVVFYALHDQSLIHEFPIPSKERRFCQSRRKVGIISASCHPCGTVEIVLSKPPSITAVLVLQWHPFSVSSSPLDGRYHLSVLIKVLGEWTEKLRDSVLKLSEQYQDSSKTKSHQLTASVEGPYGHELAYHLMYENLILVAGGIGISPFLAILSDILHRIQDKRPCLPKNVLVIWAVKRSKEFSLLSEDGKVNKSMSCPFPTTSRSSMSSLGFSSPLVNA
ncbi:hypothetical protein QJS10_CPB13g01055 [Acorus calamus]|uniref:FAD-binding FR-type domain-containing protein n=1 Tax=Acorus calamus TaxID=4465 RepID=A0AAV9DJL0_ACOCL|nr:hypothetical protein QJS10_CPB13g01055 [Acorus calamus]